MTCMPSKVQRSELVGLAMFVSGANRRMLYFIVFTFARYPKSPICLSLLLLSYVRVFYVSVCVCVCVCVCVSFFIADNISI